MRSLFAAVATLTLATPALAQQQQQPALPNCEAPEYRAFDFWIGEWDAARADNNAPAGRSSIHSEDAGCVITEHWTSVGVPYSGRSLNIYDRATQKWEQFWVDSTGNRVRFVGGPIEGGGIRIATEAPVFVSPTQQAYSRITSQPTPMAACSSMANNRRMARLGPRLTPSPTGAGRNRPPFGFSRGAPML